MKVKIVGKTYSVLFVPTGDLPNDHGECYPDEQVIKVRSELHQEQKADTLLHEIIHAIDSTVNTNLSERQVHAISGGLLGVFLDNPSLVEFLCSQQTKILSPKLSQKSVRTEKESPGLKPKSPTSLKTSRSTTKGKSKTGK